MTNYNKDIVADYGAPTNGTSDSAPAWGSFNTFLSGLSAGDTVTLNVPAHTYDFQSGSATPLCIGALGGIQVTVNATGCVFTGNFALGPVGSIVEDNAHSSRVATANVGATSVTLLTPSENTRFSVGRWIAVAGFDTMGFGAPPNPAFFEYRQITAINTVSGLISFASPLTQSYLSTWPVYNPGAASGPDSTDCGGPATIYALAVEWDLDVTHNMTGSTLRRVADNQITAKAKTVTINGGQVLAGGIIPTTNKSITFNSVDQSAVSVELDKMNETVIYSGGSTNQLIMQSMGCATNLTLTNFTVPLINGTPRNLTMTGCTVATELRIGPTAYGRSDSVTANNNSISSITYRGSGSADLIANYTMAGGVLKTLKSSGPANWAVPGTYCFFHGNQENENASCRVSSVTDDGTYTFIATNLAGGLPNVPLTTGQLFIQSHPCPVWTGTGNTGCADAVDLSQAGAQGRPLYSYSKRTYTGNTLPTAAAFQTWGQLSSVIVTVTQAYTGIQSTMLADVLGQFGGNFLSVDRATHIRYDPVVDLKTTGVRTITPTANTGSVGVDDLVSVQGNIWFSGAQGVFANHNVSGEASGLWPIITVEIMTDQGLATATTGIDFVKSFTGGGNMLMKRGRH